MTRCCIRCQTKDTASVLGTESLLIDELYRQIDVLQRSETVRGSDWVSRVEHERVVELLNATVAARNAEIDRLRKKAS